MSTAGGPSKQTLSVLLRSDYTNTAVCRRQSGMPCQSRTLEAANKFKVLFHFSISRKVSFQFSISECSVKKHVTMLYSL